jgi:hypothetical protein
MMQTIALTTSQLNKGFNAPKSAWLNSRGLNIGGFHAHSPRFTGFVASHHEPRPEQNPTPSFFEAKPGVSKEL